MNATLQAQDDPLVALKEACSNWGRWGADDRRGTLNLIDAAKVRRAAGLVAEGLTVSCSRAVPKAAEDADTATVHVMVRTTSPDASSDFLGLAPHGYGVTHLDALSHYASGGRHYNGVAANHEGIVPASEVGVDQSRSGIVSRGVLLDVPRALGRRYLEPGAVITPRELDETLDAQRIETEPGDVLLVRTGRWSASSAAKHEGSPMLAGLHPSCLPWLRRRDVALLGCDGVSDRIPCLYPDSNLPVHEVALVFMGLQLLDNLDLDELAGQAIRLQRWDFLFAVGPLVIGSGTGSPVNPLAVF